MSPEKEKFEFNISPVSDQQLSLFLYLYSAPLAKQKSDKASFELVDMLSY